jgi:hypothetical protein
MANREEACRLPPEAASVLARALEVENGRQPTGEEVCAAAQRLLEKLLSPYMEQAFPRLGEIEEAAALAPASRGLLSLILGDHGLLLEAPVAWVESRQWDGSPDTLAPDYVAPLGDEEEAARGSLVGIMYRSPLRGAVAAAAVAAAPSPLAATRLRVGIYLQAVGRTPLPGEERALRAARRAISYVEERAAYERLQDYLYDAADEGDWSLSLEPAAEPLDPEELDEDSERLPAAGLIALLDAPPGLMLPLKVAPLLSFAEYLSERLTAEAERALRARRRGGRKG